MTLFLAIESSTAHYEMALGEGGACRAEHAAGPETSRDLADLLRRLLRETGASVADIGAIGVDVGPGSLGSLRDGVNFANALAYARSLPVFAYYSFELVAQAVGEEGPLLCTRRANEGLAYAGLFEGGRLKKMRCGKLEAITRELAGEGEIACAGVLAREAASFLPGRSRVVSTEGPRAGAMLALGTAQRPACDPLRAPALPLNERARVFHE